MNHHNDHTTNISPMSKTTRDNRNTDVDPVTDAKLSWARPRIRHAATRHTEGKATLFSSEYYEASQHKFIGS